MVVSGINGGISGQFGPSYMSEGGGLEILQRPIGADRMPNHVFSFAENHRGV
jgi:hypothetical protein